MFERLYTVEYHQYKNGKIYCGVWQYPPLMMYIINIGLVQVQNAVELPEKADHRNQIYHHLTLQTGFDETSKSQTIRALCHIYQTYDLICEGESYGQLYRTLKRDPRVQELQTGNYQLLLEYRVSEP